MERLESQIISFGSNKTKRLKQERQSTKSRWRPRNIRNRTSTKIVYVPCFTITTGTLHTHNLCLFIYICLCTLIAGREIFIHKAQHFMDHDKFTMQRASWREFVLNVTVTRCKRNYKWRRLRWYWLS